MMLRFTFCLLVSISLFTSWTTSISKKLKGTWAMEKVYGNTTDVTAQHNPQNDRWITFAKDGSFKSSGTPTGKNTGKWIYSPTNNNGS